MIIVGDNLQQLIVQHRIVETEKSFDNSSITLRLGRERKQIIPLENEMVISGTTIPDKWVKKDKIPDKGIVLKPKECILACSKEKISMPLGYLGFLQTKGSLARLFVTVHCCDGQIDPGYTGQITFEICNLSNFSIKLFYRQEIAQLFIFKVSTKNVKQYDGRYKGSTAPTISRPKT